MGKVYRVGDIEKGKVVKESEFKYTKDTVTSDGRTITGMYYFTSIDRNGAPWGGYFYEFDTGIPLNENLIKIT